MIVPVVAFVNEVSVPDGLVNGAMGIVKHFTRVSSGNVHIIWVNFDNTYYSKLTQLLVKTKRAILLIKRERFYFIALSEKIVISSDVEMFNLDS